MSGYIYIVSRRLEMIYFLYQFREKYYWLQNLIKMYQEKTMEEKTEGKQKKT